MNKARTPLLLLLLALLATGIVGAKKPKWADQALMRKADYLYLEGVNREVQEDEDAAFELLNRAFTLNPNDKTIGYQYSQYLMSLMANDTTALPRSLELVRKYYEENPSDFNAAARYGFMLEYLDMQDQSLAVWEDLHKRFPENPNVTFKLANSYAQMHDTTAVRKAIALYDELQTAEGESTELELSKLRLMYMLGDTAAIYNSINTTLSNPGGRTVDHLIMAGDVYHALDQNDQALAFYKEACEVDSTSGEAFYYLASFYNAIGDSAGFDREVYNALTRQSLDPEVKSELLRGYVISHLEDSTMHPRIHELYNVLIDQHPHNSAVRESYSSYLAYLGDYEDAAEQMRYSLDIDPDQEENWVKLVSLFSTTDDSIAFRRAIDDGLHYFPDNKWLYFYSAFQYAQDNDYKHAIEEIDKAIDRTDQTDYLAQANFNTFRADALYKIGDHEGAFEGYEKALLYDPDHALTLNNYAYFLALDEQDLDRAQSMVEKAIRIDPDNLNAVDTYAWVLFKKKDYQRAREIYDSAIDELLDPENATAEAYEHAGDIYFMTGDLEQAVEFWEKAAQLDPDNRLLQKKVLNKTYFFK